MRARQSVSMAIGVLAVCLPVPSQEPVMASSPEPSFRITANLVQVEATVTDSHGKLVHGLTQSDFEVLLDGKPQPITYFSHIQTDAALGAPEAAAPRGDTSAAAAPARLRPEQVSRTTVIFVDDLSMSAESVPLVRNGVRKTIETRIGPGDLTAIVRASAGLGALQDFTMDKTRLLLAADQIKWNSNVGAAGMMSPYEVTSAIIQEQATIAALDALRRIVKGMAPLPGRKSVIVLSDSLPISAQDGTEGQPFSIGQSGVSQAQDKSPATLDPSGRISYPLSGCVDQAARAGVVIYAIDTRGLATLVMSAADRPPEPSNAPYLGASDIATQAMQTRHAMHDNGQTGGWYLARATGGLMIPESNNIAASISQIYADASSYYVLGFHPPEETFDRAANGRPFFRRLTVRVTKAGLQVRARSGFFGISDEEGTMPHVRAELTLESSLESPFGVSGIDLRLRSSFLSARKNERLVRTSLWVNAHGLTLEGPVYNRSGIVHLLVRAFAVNGAQMEGGIDTFLRVSLNEEGYERAMKWGLVYSTVIPVPKPGPYQIRAAMLDQASGKIGAANQFLMISNTPARGFQLSGIMFPQMLSKEDDITPAFGPATFGPGQRVPFAFEMIGGADEKSLQISTLLYRDGELVERSPARPLQLAGKSLHGSLFAKSEVVIPELAATGDYRLRVIVSESAPGRAGRAASQWADLEIENPEVPVKP
jgi:VWFA-related protein